MVSEPKVAETDLAFERLPLSEPYSEDTPPPATTSFISGSLQGRPLKGLYRWLRPALYIYIASLTLVAVSAFAMLDFLDEVQNGAVSGGLAESQGADLDTLSRISNITLAVLLIASGFLLMRFVFRAMKNLHLSQAAGVTISPGWAVGYNFVPILLLWKPLQAMRQIWRGSHDPQNADAKVPATMGWWWALWIGTNILAGISMQIQLGLVLSEVTDHFFEQAKIYNQIEVITSVASVISVACLLHVLKGITEAQEERLSYGVSEDFR